MSAENVHVTVPLSAVFRGSGSAATDPRFMQYLQHAVQEAVARWSKKNPPDDDDPPAAGAMAA